MRPIAIVLVLAVILWPAPSFGDGYRIDVGPVLKKGARSVPKSPADLSPGPELPVPVDAPAPPKAVEFRREPVIDVVGPPVPPPVAKPPKKDPVRIAMASDPAAGGDLCRCDCRCPACRCVAKVGMPPLPAKSAPAAYVPPAPAAMVHSAYTQATYAPAVYVQPTYYQPAATYAPVRRPFGFLGGYSAGPMAGGYMSGACAGGSCR